MIDLEQSALIEQTDRLAALPARHYVISRTGLVHVVGKCIGPPQVAEVVTVKAGEEIVGWLYWKPCKRCRP